MKCLQYFFSIIFAILLITNNAYAGASPPVAHSHYGRTHSHPLPPQGIKHEHNKGNVKNKARKKNPVHEAWMKHMRRVDKCRAENSIHPNEDISAIVIGQEDFFIKRKKNYNKCLERLKIEERKEEYKKNKEYPPLIEQSSKSTNQFRCVNRKLPLLEIYKTKGLSHIAGRGLIRPTISIIYPDETRFIQPLESKYIYYLNNFFNINPCIVLYNDTKFKYSKMLSTSYSPKGYDGLILIAISMLEQSYTYHTGGGFEIDYLSMMLSHEYAHIYLKKKNFNNIKTKRNLHDRTEELLCDFLAGFYYAKHGSLSRPLSLKGEVPKPTVFPRGGIPNFSKDFLSFWSLGEENLSSNMIEVYGPEYVRHYVLKKGTQYGGGFLARRAAIEIYLQEAILHRNINAAYNEGLDVVSRKEYQFTRGNIHRSWKGYSPINRRSLSDDIKRWIRNH